jgi:hypothetical protein
VRVAVSQKKMQMTRIRQGVNRRRFGQALAVAGTWISNQARGDAVAIGRNSVGVELYVFPPPRLLVPRKLGLEVAIPSGYPIIYMRSKV